MTSPPASAATPPRPGLPLLIAMSAMGPIALVIFLPSMPALEQEFAASHETVQLTLTAYLISLAVSQLFVGPLSDRFGRRPVFLIGTVFFILTSIAATLAGSIEQLIFWRIAQAASGCAGVVIGRAIVRDIFARDKAASALGYVTMAMIVAPMMAPALGGVLEEYLDWRAGFILVACLGATLLAVAWFTLYETHLERSATLGVLPLASNSLSLFREPAFLAYALNTACGSGIYFAFLAGGPFIAIQILKLPPSAYGYYFIMVSLGYMFGNFLSGRYAEAAGANRMIAWGSACMVAGIVLLIALNLIDVAHALVLFGPMSVVALSNGLTIPSATAAAISVRPDIAGAGSGLVGFFQFGIGSAATICVAALHDGTSLATIIVMTVSAALAFAFMLMAFRVSR